jgi:hypothetical protein
LAKQCPKERPEFEPERVPPRCGSKSVKAWSMPIVEQARKHTPDNDRCVSQYGLPVDERGRPVEVSSATECVGWTVRGVAVLSWGLKRGGGPHWM